jgi:hypothetical protein
MGQIIGNINIKRISLKDKILNQNINQNNIIDQNINQNDININQNNININQNNDYLMLQEFKNNVQIRKNGEIVENNYYSDFKSYNNTIYNNSLNNNNQILYTNEPVEQIDPNEFFNNSMNGLIKNLKK